MAYDVKACQFKTTIVNCTEVQLKVFKISANHRRDVGKADKYVTQL